MEEEEKVQKLTYINENIIEKGYNPEELSNFVIKKTGIPMENMGLEQLKEMVEKFKDQSLQDTYQTVKIKEVSKKEESPFDILYSNQVYDDIKTQPPQKNKMLEIEENKEKIVIFISEPKKEKSGGFFSRPIFSYKITTPVIGKEVRRTYNDFEWLREQFVLRYTLRIVPFLIKENNLINMEIIDKGDIEYLIEEKKMEYLGNFIRKIIDRKIFRTSPLLFEFLGLDENNFKKYKDISEKNKYELNVTLDNLRTIKDKIHFEMKKEDIKKADTFYKKYNKLGEIYQKMDKSLTMIYNDFQLIEKHMKDIAECFNQLSNEFSEKENKIKKIFSELNIVFNQWSACYKSQYNFFKNSFKSLFKSINLETQELSTIYKNYIEYKKEYEDFTERVNKRKEELFEQKDYKNWSLVPGTENQLPMFQNNKKIAFEKMLYRETILLAEEKKRVACAVYYLFKEYNKMIQNQSNEIENYFKKLKGNNKYVIADAYSLIKLFSVVKEDKNEEKNNEKKK